MRARVGGISKGVQIETEGFDELVKNLRRMSDQARVQILEKAVDRGSKETLNIMQQLAPRAPGAGTRGWHGADRLINAKIFSRRDSRAQAVGIGRKTDGAWWLKFAELGTIWSAETPFILPAGRAMERRMVQLVIQAWRRATQKAIKT